jgi:hypothetical protein
LSTRGAVRAIFSGWHVDPIARDRGFNFRVFAKREIALEWLGASGE